MGIFGDRDCPTAAASEKTALIREICSMTAVDDSVQTDHALLLGIPEEMIEDVFGEVGMAANLHHLSDSARLGIVDVPANDPIRIISE